MRNKYNVSHFSGNLSKQCPTVKFLPNIMQRVGNQKLVYLSTSSVSVLSS